MIKLGLNEDIENDDYHGDTEFMSSSALKLLLTDEFLFHEKYIKGINNVSSSLQSIFDFGTYVHANILEPHTVSRDFFHSEGGTKASKIYKEDKVNNPDKIVITEGEYKSCMAMMSKFHNDKIASGLIQNGMAESTWGSVLLGKKIKARPDYLVPGKYIVDVKTTSKPLDKISLEEVCREYCYDLSAALYIDCIECHHPGPYEFYFIFLNKKTKQTVVAKASEKFLREGREKYQEAIRTHDRLLKTDFTKKDYYGNIMVIGG